MQQLLGEGYRPNHIARVSNKEVARCPNSTHLKGRKRNIDPNDPRPKPSYHQLIRKALIDHPRRKMTLNEIYQWFSKTYSYYAARPAPNAQWKNR